MWACVELFNYNTDSTSITLLLCVISNQGFILCWRGELIIAQCAEYTALGESGGLLPHEILKISSQVPSGAQGDYYTLTTVHVHVHTNAYLYFLLATFVIIN